jgi:mono/diheme cytochrome c family protein
MNDDVRKVIYGTIIGFLVVVLSWLTLIYLSACGFTLSCYRATPLVVRTPIPTLIPVKFPAATKYVVPPPTPTLLATLPPESDTPVPGEPAVDVARPSNPGGPGPAVGLQGDINRGKEIYAANCEYCHAADGKGDLPNPGTTDGTVPPLNPIDPTLVNADYQTFAYNLDLFLEHGSVPEGTEPTRSMPAWGDNGALTPQQIADVIAYIISLNK